MEKEKEGTAMRCMQETEDRSLESSQGTLQEEEEGKLPGAAAAVAADTEVNSLRCSQ